MWSTTTSFTCRAQIPPRWRISNQRRNSSICSWPSMGPKPLPRVEHIRAFPAGRAHLRLNKIELALLHLKYALRDLRPVEFREVLDDLQRGDDEDVYEAL